MRYFTKFQTPEKLFGSSFLHCVVHVCAQGLTVGLQGVSSVGRGCWIQKVPASSCDPPREQPSPSAKLGEPGETDSRKGYRQQQQRKREPRKEEQQRDPKGDLRRRAEGASDLEQRSFPGRPGETPLEKIHPCSSGKSSQERKKEERTGEVSWWEGYVLVSLSHYLNLF